MNEMSYRQSISSRRQNILEPIHILEPMPKIEKQLAKAIDFNLSIQRVKIDIQLYLPDVFLSRALFNASINWRVSVSSS